MTALARIDVEEGLVPQRVSCTSDGFPTQPVKWTGPNGYSGDGFFSQEVHRSDAGAYTCTATNKHGFASTETYLNVMYKPNCTIERKEMVGDDTLICTANGNPLLVSKSEKENNLISVTLACRAVEGIIIFGH